MNPRSSRVKIPEELNPVATAAILLSRLGDAISDDPRIKIISDLAIRQKREARDQKIIDESLAAAAKKVLT